MLFCYLHKAIKLSLCCFLLFVFIWRHKTVIYCLAGNFFKLNSLSLVRSFEHLANFMTAHIYNFFHCNVTNFFIVIIWLLIIKTDRENVNAKKRNFIYLKLLIFLYLFYFDLKIKHEMCEWDMICWIYVYGGNIYLL